MLLLLYITQELETLSLASRRPSLDRDDFSSSGRLGFLRRPSLDGSVDGSNNEGGRLDFNNLSSGNSRSSRSSAGPSGTSNRYSRTSFFLLILLIQKYSVFIVFIRITVQQFFHIVIYILFVFLYY